MAGAEGLKKVFQRTKMAKKVPFRCKLPQYSSLCEI